MLRALEKKLKWGGLRYHCPLCGGRFRRMAGKRAAECPNCFAPERTRLLWLYLSNEVALAGKLLHIAPERGLERKLRDIDGLDYLSVDLEADAMVRADLTELPFDDSQFDLVICSHVLEHISDDRRAMRECRRVTRGTALLMHPQDHSRAVSFEPPSSSPAERLRLFGQDDHVRIYGRDLEDRLREAGFRVEVVNYAQRLMAKERTRYRLMDETIHICR